MQIYGDFEGFLETIVHEVRVVIFHDTWRSRGEGLVERCGRPTTRIL